MPSSPKRKPRFILNRLLRVELTLHPKVINPGDAVFLSAQAVNRFRNLPGDYYFCSTAGTIHGREDQSKGEGWIETDGLPPGQYLVKVHVNQGMVPWEQADAEAWFEIGSY